MGKPGGKGGKEGGSTGSKLTPGDLKQMGKQRKKEQKRLGVQPKETQPKTPKTTGKGEKGDLGEKTRDLGESALNFAEAAKGLRKKHEKEAKRSPWNVLMDVFGSGKRESSSSSEESPEDDKSKAQQEQNKNPTLVGLSAEFARQAKEAKERKGKEEDGFLVRVGVVLKNVQNTFKKTDIKKGLTEEQQEIIEDMLNKIEELAKYKKGDDLIKDREEIIKGMRSLCSRMERIDEMKPFAQLFEHYAKKLGEYKPKPKSWSDVILDRSEKSWNGLYRTLKNAGFDRKDDNGDFLKIHQNALGAFHNVGVIWKDALINNDLNLLKKNQNFIDKNRTLLLKESLDREKGIPKVEGNPEDKTEINPRNPRKR